VIYDGYSGLYYAYQYGNADITTNRPVDADTKYRIASLSKLVVAICAVMLADEGKLDLDEDIAVYLGYTVRNPDFPNTPITSRMLLQHTSSIYDSAPFYDSIMGRNQASTQNLLARSSSYWGRKPGTAFEYSNFGYTVLGAVCELASGIKLDTLARDILFEPLDIDAGFLARNLKDTSNIAALYDNNHDLARSVDTQLGRVQSDILGEDQHLAQGSLVISAFDFAKILAMLGNGGVFRNEQILSPESVVEIHHANVAGPGYMQGLATRFSDDGSFLPGIDFYWHTGSAYGVFAQYIYLAGSGTEDGIGGADTSRGIVIVTTGASTGRLSNGMVRVCTDLAAVAWQGLGFDR
jgi:CubicO group peptidase (beta-lactamase class C family)